MDKQIRSIIQAEQNRQHNEINLIASENYANQAILDLQGSVLTNKYAEGYPNARYYAGCGPSDEVESLAISLGKQLFQAGFMNVQPHSGSSANAAVYQALMSPGDAILGLSIKDGGHLTHGVKVNFSGQMYTPYYFGIKDCNHIDYDDLYHKATTHKPKVIVVGYSSFSGLVDWQICRQIADDVGAYLLADIAHISGLVAAGLYPSPVAFADVCTSTTHKTLRGPRGGIIFGRANEEIERKINKAVFPGSQGGPLMHVVAAKAQAFSDALLPSFKEYQQQTLANAKALSEALVAEGFTVMGEGTENHMLVIDCRSLELTGAEAEKRLDENGIIVNRNAIKNDPKPPRVTSGLRLGVPAVTTRCMKEAEMRHLAHLIRGVLIDGQTVLHEVKQLCDAFPVPMGNYAESLKPLDQ